MTDYAAKTMSFAFGRQPNQEFGEPKKQHYDGIEIEKRNAKSVSYYVINFGTFAFRQLQLEEGELICVAPYKNKMLLFEKWEDDGKKYQAVQRLRKTAWGFQLRYQSKSAVEFFDQFLGGKEYQNYFLRQVEDGRYGIIKGNPFVQESKGDQPIAR